MDEKKADNRIIGNRREIESLDNQISEEREKLNRIEDIETEFVRIKNGVDNTVSLLSQSIKGGNVKGILDSVSTDSGKMVSSALNSIGEDREVVKNKIKRLNDERDELTDNN
jgi:hypothetical protein